MQIIALIGILYFFIGACVCLLICANPNDPGIVGKSRRFVFNTLPDAFSYVASSFQVFCQKSLWRKSTRIFKQNQSVSARNQSPTSSVVLLLNCSWWVQNNQFSFIGYTIMGIFKHMPNQYVSDYQVIAAYVMAGLCFWVYYKACSVSPGEVTTESSQHFTKKYEGHYDEIIYKKNNKCSTCDVIKPARSKHCNICKMCVSKFDHHCIWQHFSNLRIRQCVGQRNYKYFISFLFLHSIWCCYLAIIGAYSLYASLLKMKFWQNSFRIGNQIVKADNILAFQYLFVMETFFFFIIVMCAIMGITLFIFVSYHFYLIGKGQTTNERVKKNDYIDYLRKQKKYIEKFMHENPDLPAEINYRNEKMPRKDFLEFKEDVNYKLSILEKKTPNPGFWANLKTVFTEPDQ